MESAFETVAGGSAPFFKFDTVGKKLKGKVVGRRTIESSMSKTGQQDVVDLLTTDGEYTVALTADLKKKFTKIDDGDLVSVEFISTKPIKGKAAMKVFNVMRAKGS